MTYLQRGTDLVEVPWFKNIRVGQTVRWTQGGERYAYTAMQDEDGSIVLVATPPPTDHQ